MFDILLIGCGGVVLLLLTLQMALIAPRRRRGIDWHSVRIVAVVVAALLAIRFATRFF